MPDWKRVLSEIAKSVEAAARESRTTPRGRQVAFRESYRPNKCLFWDCNASIRADYVFCYDHFLDLQEGLIDECPGCGQAKDIQYDVCLKCYRIRRPILSEPDNQVQSQAPVGTNPNTQKLGGKGMLLPASFSSIFSSSMGVSSTLVRHVN